MGKSNIKCKSERINALRKQYDAFLDEDKKRKERNEFILGRLDRMRQSTALVLLRHKPNTVRHWTSAVSGQRYPGDFTGTRDLHIPVNRHQPIKEDALQHIDTCSIEDITKNYILIPKLRSTFKNPQIEHENPIGYVPELQQDTFDTSNVITSNDNSWQKKYDILTILKNEEKGNKTMQSLSSAKDNILSNNNEKKYSNTDTNVGTEYKYLEELPEKEVTAEKARNYEIKHSEPSNDYQTVPKHSDVNSITSPDEIPKQVEVDNINHKLRNFNLDHNQSEVIDNTNNVKHDGHPKVDNTHEPYQHTQHSDQFESVYNNDETSGKQNPDMYEQDHVEASNELNPESKITPDQYQPAGAVDADNHDVNRQETVNGSHLVDESNNINAPVHELTDNLDYIKQNVSVEEIAPNLVHPISGISDTTDTTEQDYVKHVDGIALDHNVSPIDNFSEVKDALAEKEQPFDNTEIDAFDAEQREMFYVEQQEEENHTYQQEDINMDELGYPVAEQGENVNQYHYYDDTQPEGDAGENVETLGFDAAYQQQYDNSYENTYENQQQQNAEENHYDPMQSQELQTLYDQQNNSEEVQPLYEQQNNAEDLQSSYGQQNNTEELLPSYDQQINVEDLHTLNDQTNNDTTDQVGSALNTEEGYSEQTHEQNE